MDTITQSRLNAFFASTRFLSLMNYVNNVINPVLPSPETLNPMTQVNALIQCTSFYVRYAVLKNKERDNIHYLRNNDGPIGGWYLNKESLMLSDGNTDDARLFDLTLALLFAYKSYEHHSEIYGYNPDSITLLLFYASQNMDHFLIPQLGETFDSNIPLSAARAYLNYFQANPTDREHYIKAGKAPEWPFSFNMTTNNINPAKNIDLKFILEQTITWLCVTYFVQQTV